MAPTGSTGLSESSAWPGDALLPATLLEGGPPDPVALATWHLALAASSATEVPNDLFALWLFPDTGAAVLLGPEGLARDAVPVPLPHPELQQDDLYQLEEVLRRAKYASAIAVPIRLPGRDVGVMLLGSFALGAFGPSQALVLYRFSARLAPAMARLAETVESAASHASLEPPLSREELPERLARAACESATGAELVRRVSGILYGVVPHDRLEIVIPGSHEGSLIPLSGRTSRRRWSTGGGVGSPAGSSGDAYPVIAACFDGATLLLEDFSELDDGVQWPVGGSPPSLPARSVLGARLEVAGRLAGYLLLGSVAHDAYRPDDEELLELAGLVVAPRVAALRLSEAASASSPTTEASRQPAAREAPLSRAAAGLADTAHLGEGLADFAAELARQLPHRGISLRLRSSEAELITLNPGALRPLADLPASPLDDFAGAEVVRGEREWLIQERDDGVELFVPLRVAGRTMGVLGVRSEAFDSGRSAAAIARQFADVLAPHLELLRRGAGRIPTVGARG